MGMARRGGEHVLMHPCHSSPFMSTECSPNLTPIKSGLRIRWPLISEIASLALWCRLARVVSDRGRG